MKMIEQALESLIVEKVGTLPITDDDWEEAKEIIRRFLDGPLAGAYHITELERVYNDVLEKRYDAAKRKYPRLSHHEEITFHGTESSNIIA